MQLSAEHKKIAEVRHFAHLDNGTALLLPYSRKRTDRVGGER